MCTLSQQLDRYSSSSISLKMAFIQDGTQDAESEGFQHLDRLSPLIIWLGRWGRNGIISKGSLNSLTGQQLPPFLSTLHMETALSTPIPWTMSSCRCRVGRGGRVDSLSENPFSGVLEPPLPSLKGGGRFPAWTWRSCSKSLRAALTSQFFPVRTQSKKWIGSWEYRKIEERYRTIILSILSKPASIYSCVPQSFSFSFPYFNFLHNTSIWNTTTSLFTYCLFPKKSLCAYRICFSELKGPLET